MSAKRCAGCGAWMARGHCQYCGPLFEEPQRSSEWQKAKAGDISPHRFSDELGKQIARNSLDGICWFGWIRGDSHQEQGLRELGVQGLMLHSYCSSHGGIFEQCLCDTDAMERLRKEYRLFWPGTFTGCNINGDQLPREHQKYGKLTHENYNVGRDRGTRGRR